MDIDKELSEFKFQIDRQTQEILQTEKIVNAIREQNSRFYSSLSIISGVVGLILTIFIAAVSALAIYGDIKSERSFVALETRLENQINERLGTAKGAGDIIMLDENYNDIKVSNRVRGFFQITGSGNARLRVFLGFKNIGTKEAKLRNLRIYFKDFDLLANQDTEYSDRPDYPFLLQLYPKDFNHPIYPPLFADVSHYGLRLRTASPEALENVNHMLHVLVEVFYDDGVAGRKMEVPLLIEVDKEIKYR